MPGAGINKLNAGMLIEETGAREIHLSGKTVRPSKMKTNKTVTMGNNASSDSQVEVTDFHRVNRVIKLLNG